MATNLFANVRGQVFKTEHREGFAKDSGAAYSMDIVTVLVVGGGLSEVVLPEPLPTEALQSLQGQSVDFLIEVYRNAKGFGTRLMRNDVKCAELAGKHAQQKAA